MEAEDTVMIIEKRAYYNRGKIEAIDASESAGTGRTGYEGFLTGNCLKSLFRWRWKGTAVADLRKARYYLDRLIAEQEKALGIEHAETMPEHFEQDRQAMAEDTKRTTFAC